MCMDVGKLCVDKWKMATCNGSTIFMYSIDVYCNSRCFSVCCAEYEIELRDRAHAFFLREIPSSSFIRYEPCMKRTCTTEGWQKGERERQIWWAYTMWKKGLLSGLPFYILCMRLWWNYSERIAIWMATWIHRVQSFCLFICFLFVRVSRFFFFSISYMHEDIVSIFFCSVASDQWNRFEMNGIKILPIQNTATACIIEVKAFAHTDRERQQTKKKHKNRIKRRRRWRRWRRLIKCFDEIYWYHSWLTQW